MNQTPKRKNSNHKTFRGKHRSKTSWPWIRQRILKCDSKKQAAITREIDKLDITKIKMFVLLSEKKPYKMGEMVISLTIWCLVIKSARFKTTGQGGGG